MSQSLAIVAARRFGLGWSREGLAQIAGDPRGWLLAGLADPRAALIESSTLVPGHVVFHDAQLAFREIKRMRALTDAAGRPANAMQDGDMMLAEPQAQASGGDGARGEIRGQGASEGMDEPAEPAQAGLVKPADIRKRAFRAEAAARIAHAGPTRAPFLERLVMFWSNHFCVSAAKGPVRGIAGAYEREAIRPHVLGRFSDMLLAVAQHPAMLIYLDNQVSTGPNSPVGRRRERGLNENLAREILELHTLGVDGGYSQGDVTNLARLLTGWSVGRADRPNTVPGRFHFARARHEPGRFPVLGKTYRNGDVGAGEACLADLARHPATARHIARKLAIHFVSDSPPPDLVAKLAWTFRETDGDLAAMARTLVETDAAWELPARKILPPYDFLIGLGGAFGIDLPVKRVLRLAQALGQPLWQPPSPKGWPDGDDAWLAPSAIRERLRVAELAADAIVKTGADPRQSAQDLFGPSLSEATRQAIDWAETRDQGFELLIMSPEFQRR